MINNSRFENNNGKIWSVIAIRKSSSLDVVVKNVKFLRNIGSCMALDDIVGSSLFENVDMIENNDVSGNSQRVGISFVGVTTLDTSKKHSFKNCKFIRNSYPYHDGGSLSFREAAKLALYVQNCLFEGNR